MVERRLIRVLVPYSRTLYYTDKGRERGITAELAREWERYIGKKYAKQLDRRPVTVVIIPTTRDKLIPGVVAGLGDIARDRPLVTLAVTALGGLLAARHPTLARDLIAIVARFSRR